MSYLKFQKALMTNLQESLRREYLRTSRSGAYSSSTVVDCNTRKYHGLFVVPIPSIDDVNHVLLSSLDASVVQHGAEFNLGLHLYQGGVCSPNGHKYIREYNCDRVPTTIYRVGGVMLRKETIMQNYDDRVMVRYTVDDAHSPVTLRLRPFLAFRRCDELTHENYQAKRDYSGDTDRYRGYLHNDILFALFAASLLFTAFRRLFALFLMKSVIGLLFG